MARERKSILKSRSDILIREVFYSGLTWEDLERLFDLNQEDLKHEVKEYLSATENPEERFCLLEEQIKLNRKNKNRSFDSMER